MRFSWTYVLGLLACVLGAVPVVARAQDPFKVELSAPPAPKQIEVKVSPNTGQARVEIPDEPDAPPLADVALQNDWMDPRYIENSRFPDEPGIWERSRLHGSDLIHRILEDYRNFYLTRNILHVGVAVGLAAPLANTHADIGMRDWYQRGAGVGRSRGLDETARVFKYFGDYQYAVPAYLLLSMSSNLFPDHVLTGIAADFGDRSLRALAVGAPMVGILQVGLGPDRPPFGDSRWQPFRASHGASGHAFVGAVPFLTAASMTESRALKAVLIAGSLAPGWSRIHQDRHYVSQVFLGWSIALLSVHSVNQTDSRYRIVPYEVPNGVGLGVHVEF